MKLFITGNFDLNDFAVVNEELTAMAYCHDEQFDGEPLLVIVPSTLKAGKYTTFPGTSAIAKALSVKRGFQVATVSLEWQKEKKTWDTEPITKLLGPNDRILFIDPNYGKSSASTSFPPIPGMRVVQHGSLRDKPAYNITETYLKKEKVA